MSDTYPVRQVPPATLASWLLLSAAWGGIYAATLSPGAQWQDAGEHIMRVVTGELVNPLGLALSHPLHYWVGRLVLAPDMLEPGVAVTLISAAGAAATVANVFGCVLTWTACRLAAWFAALSLAVAGTFWQMATVAEVYSISTALLAAEFWCLAAFARTRQPRWLLGMALANGLGISNHMLAALTTPVVAGVLATALARSQVSLRQAVIAALTWVAGTLPYSGLVLLEILRTGEPGATIQSALFGHDFQGRVLNTAISGRLLLVGFAFPLYNFPNLLIPAAVYGVLARHRYRAGAPMRALQAALVIHAVFALRYDVVDQHTFFLPLYALLAIAGGLGAAALLEQTDAWTRRRLVAGAATLIVATPAMYVVFTSVARHYGVLDGVARNKPYRDDYVYVLIPWAIADGSAERMSTEALRLAGPQGLVAVEDRMAEAAVRYAARRAGFADGSVVPAALSPIAEAARQGRTVVLVPSNADHPRVAPPVGRWERRGDLYVLSVPARSGVA